MLRNSATATGPKADASSYDLENHSQTSEDEFSEGQRQVRKKDRVKRNSCQTLFLNIVNFWSKAPHYIWSLFVESFYIPAYRYEWGKYRKWSYETYGDVEGLKEHERLAYHKSKIQRKKFIEKRRKEKKLLGETAIEKHEGCRRIRINCSGNIFETQLRTLQMFPDTLLGDPERRERYWNPKKEEYFFDRHAECFESILHFYQTGGSRLERPHRVTMDTFRKEIRFYEIKGHRVYEFEEEEVEEQHIQKHAMMPDNLLKRKLWLLLEYPKSSSQARLFSYLSILAIITSTMAYCIDTMDIFSGGYGPHNEIVDLKDPMYFTEFICIIFFILEFVGRLMTCPGKLIFMKTFTNIVDFISIIPFCVELIVFTSHHRKLKVNKLEINYIQFIPGTLLETFIRSIKCARVFRILKLSRYSLGLRILGQTLRTSLNELGLLAFFLMVGVILFSSALFFIEGYFNPDSKLSSIPGTFFWAVSTMTTVGYGSDDELPKTVAGKIIGSFCAVAGVLTLSLPVPVVVANFSYFYQLGTRSGKKKKISNSYVRQCPNQPTCEKDDGELWTNDLRKASKLGFRFRRAKLEPKIFKSRSRMSKSSKASVQSQQSSMSIHGAPQPSSTNVQMPSSSSLPRRTVI